MNPNKLAFINWLKWMRKVSPELYALFKVEHPDIIAGLTPDGLGFWDSIDWGSIAKTATDFVGKALPIYQQNQAFKQQLELAKLQIQAPAAFQQQAPAPQQTYTPVAVPPSTPNTSTVPAPTAAGAQPLVIRIDSSQLPEVKKEAEKVKSDDWQKYLPLAIGGGLLFLAMR